MSIFKPCPKCGGPAHPEYSDTMINCQPAPRDLVSDLKRAILATLAIQGSAGFGVAFPNDAAIRACAELIVERLCREDSDGQGNFLLVITRAGLEATK